MPNGYKRIYNDFLYFRKDHFCPDCHTKLKKVAVSKIVNSSSPEASDYDFKIGKTHIVGDVQFTWDELECPSCKKHLTVDEMRKIEGGPDKNEQRLEKLLFFVIIIVFLVLLYFVSRFI